MTDFSERLLPWQQSAWQLLCSYQTQGRIPQALLISGAKSIGKATLAFAFAKTLLCGKPDHNGFACGHCRSCGLLAANNHPDLLVVQPEEDKASIGINQIRQVINDISLKPHYDAYRVAIINPADGMTLAAANAFLKCLEEPTERTVFILLCQRPSKLPATIISRCQHLKLSFSSQPELHNWVQSQGITQNQATLSNLLSASFITLPQLTDADLPQRRLACFNDWLSVADAKHQPSTIAEKWLKLSKDEVVAWQLSWLTDVIKSCYRLPSDHFCNQDLIAPIQALAQRLNLVLIFKYYDYLLICRRQIDTQLNLQLLLEDLLIQWQLLNRRL